MSTYNAIILEDQRMDSLLLKKIISDYCINISILAQAITIEEGILEINNKKPDIVFLDIMFEGLVIFDFLDKFNLNEVQVIFVSSEKEYALNAFESNAVDFILKPVRVENVILAVNKAIKKIEINNFCLTNEYQNVKIKNNKFNYLAVSSLDKIDFLKMSDIMFCMAEGKYTTFFLLNGKKIVSSKNLGEYEKLLDNSNFYRTHHAYIINIRYLISVIKRDGSYCELSNRVTIPIAKRRLEDFNKFIKVKF
jgi:two-component system LytT family response regulator